MKRYIIGAAIVGAVIFVAFQFISTDRKSRLKVDPDKYENELTILSQEASFNETVKVKRPGKSKTAARKLVKNVAIAFEVPDVSKTRNDITLLTNDTGGYIASERNYKSDGLRTTCEHIVRIPVDMLDEFISKVETLATRIDDRRLSTEDVTEEYYDVEGRLVAKKEIEARYREIAKQANTVEDVLKVEHEIGIVRSEIESLERSVKLLSDVTAYSTITLTYYQPLETPVNEVPGIGSKFANAFVGGWDSLLDLSVELAGIWPLLVILTIASWLLFRYTRKHVSV